MEPVRAQNGAGGTGGGGMACVLWHSAQTELPGELISTIARNIGRVTVCTDGFAAMAEACLLQRAGRRSPGGEARHVGVMLFVQPRLLAGVREVYDAVELFAPGLLRWQYDRSDPAKLRAIVPSDVATWGAVKTAAAVSVVTRPVATPGEPRASGGVSMMGGGAVVVGSGLGSGGIVGPGVEAGPRLRLSGTEAERAPAGPGGGAGGAPAEPGPARAAPLLTEEELRMLLSDDPPGPGNGPGNGPGHGQGNGMGRKGHS